MATIPIYERLLTAPAPSAREMTDMDDRLIGGWRQQLPAYFADADLILSQEHLLGHTIGRWRLRIMRIIMYRPFFLRWVQDGMKTDQFDSDSENQATFRCLIAAEECVNITSHFWYHAVRTRLAAWYALYFLLQAVLIPVHCLRRTAFHPKVHEWRSQVSTALGLMDVLADINPNAVKCKDVIMKLCGSHLLEQPIRSGQQISDNPFAFNPSSPNVGDWNAQSWTTELDTTINHFDMSYDYLTNMPQENPPGVGSAYVGLEAFNISSFGLSSGSYDLDPGMILMQ